MYISSKMLFAGQDVLNWHLKERLVPMPYSHFQCLDLNLRISGIS